jgi:hypothetical protein
MNASVLGTLKTSFAVQNLNIGRNDLKTAKNECGSASVLGTLKTSFAVQNLNIGRNDLKTAKNECGSAKYENQIQQPRNCRK